MVEAQNGNPKAFVSYTWKPPEHKNWVRELATKLRAEDGVEVTLDQWHTAPGDQLTHFMEQAVSSNNYVLIICTPIYKRKSDNREGGVGYEGDIMTAQAISTGNERKFLPILASGTWEQAAPIWLLGKYYVDLTGDNFAEGYEDLRTTLLGLRPEAPPLGRVERVASERVEPAGLTAGPDAPIKITGIILDEVGQPLNDGSRGSALYRVPFQLSKQPSPEWARHFVQTWDRPPRFTSMHRPGIARVSGSKVILDGTTVDEVKQYHRDTLIAVVEKVNEDIAQYEAQKRGQEKARRLEHERHESSVRNAARDIDFD